MWFQYKSWLKLMMYVVFSSSTWRKYYFSDLMNMAAWQAYIGIRPWVIMTKVKTTFDFQRTCV